MKHVKCIILYFILSNCYYYAIGHIIQQPQTRSICINGSTYFKIKSDTISTFQWQDSSSSGWNNLANIKPFFGVSSDSLVLDSVSSSISGKRIRCIVTSGLRKDTSIIVSIIVRPLPTSTNFSIGNNSQCLNGNSFMFTNTSTGASSYLWNFGDASTSTTTSPSYSYSSSGTFSVKLVSFTNYGCKDSITKTVDIKPSPGSSFTINNNSQCLNGNSFMFTNTSTGAISYLWNFSDASTSTTTSPSHSYSTIGTYSVKLVSTTTYGCKDSITKTIYVRPHPISTFTINNNSQCLNSNNFIFTNTATGASSYLWRFGDASTSTTTSPYHNYSSTGNYTVILISITSYGCKDSITKTLDVLPNPSSAFTINNNSQCITGNYFSFTNTSSGATSYLWNFGDATTSTSSSPYHNYSSSGAFSVKLVTINSYGCKDSITKIIDVRPLPGSSFIINNNSQCLSINNFSFTNNTSVSSSYLWNFGDAITSTLTSPFHSYTSTGTFTVKLVSTTSYGCKDSTIKTLDVRPQPTSTNFTIANNSQCLTGNNFLFTNTSTGASLFLWNFGDASSTTVSSPSHSYSTSGTFSVKLVSFTGYGCKDSITKTIYVRPLPGSSFTINNNSQCFNGNNFVFTNNTSVSSTYLWNFGDASTSTTTSPSHSYSSIGSFSVKLISTTSYGCKDSTTYTIYTRPHPISSFTINNNSQCLSGNNFIFTNTATGATSYLWRFGDATTSLTTSPYHSYTSSGNYTVKLISISYYGCKDSTTKILDVRPQPTSNFLINNNSQCLYGNNFVFTNTAIGASTYFWNFGDGNTSLLNSPAHSYSSIGSYSIKLVSTSIYGCKDSILKNIDIRPHPVSSFTINNISQCLSGNNFIFNNTSLGAATYVWNFGDATTSTSSSPFHSYTSTGAFTVKLVSTTIYGCKDSTIKTLDVRPQPTSTNFSIGNNSQCLNGNSFMFTNTSTGASSYLWNFGDASTSTTTSPSFSYSTSGTFSVKLVSFTGYGCKDSITKTINVRPLPGSSFTLNNNSQCFNGNNFVFTNNTSISSTYLWNFGDASTSTTTSPSHSYSSIGSFSVKLVSKTSYGCKDSTTYTIYTRPHPISSFTINNNSQCLSGNNFILTNTATGATSYLWRFGDATTSLTTSPYHSYTSSGNYTVKLISISFYGCKDSTTKILDVRPQPTSNFLINNNSQCLNGNNFVFTNTTIGASKYFWSFGDSNTSVTFSPSYTFTSIGSYSIELISTSNYGCIDSIIKLIYVRPHPISQFTIDSTLYCLSGNNFKFTNLSTGAATFLWKFGDATTSVMISPTHSFFSTGKYVIKLISTTNYNCKDSLSDTLNVYPLPDTSLIIGNINVCKNQQELIYQLAKDNKSYNYFWNISSGTILSGIYKSIAYITWDDKSGKDTIKILQTNIITGCKNIMKLPINILDSRAPDKSTILRKPNSNILVCNTDTSIVKIQWGYITKSNGIFHDIQGANLQYVLLPHNFDTSTYIYYIKTSTEGCLTISYLEYNPIPVNIKDFDNKDQFNIFPNPVSNKLYVSNIELKSFIVIIKDINGQIINPKVNFSDNSFDLSQFNNGVYFLIVIHKDFRYVKRFQVIK